MNQMHKDNQTEDLQQGMLWKRAQHDQIRIFTHEWGEIIVAEFGIHSVNDDQRLRIAGQDIPEAGLLKTVTHRIVRRGDDQYWVFLSGVEDAHSHIRDLQTEAMVYTKYYRSLQW